jgi:hypothetical protein
MLFRQIHVEANDKGFLILSAVSTVSKMRLRCLGEWLGVNKLGTMVFEQREKVK